MQIGPLQLVAIGYADGEGLREQVKSELAAVRGRGVIRLLDVLFARRDAGGELAVIEDDDLADAEMAEYGLAIRRLLGIDAASAAPAGTTDGDHLVGLSPADVQELADKVKPGMGVALVLFEHVWAGGLAASLEEAGGHVLGQGILTRDLIGAIGPELAAIETAEHVREAEQASRMATLLDAVAFAPAAGESEAVVQAAPDEATTQVVGRVLRILAAADVIDAGELEPAVLALLDAGLLSSDTVERGVAAAFAQEARYAGVSETQRARA